jgi:hypothetical protein
MKRIKVKVVRAMAEKEALNEKPKGKRKGRVKMADRLIRLNPFQISKTKDGVTTLRKQYGDNVMTVVRGSLFERARGVLFTFQELTGETGKKLNFYLPDIAHAMGAKNPYDERILQPLREDIKALLAAEVRLNLDKPSPKKELCVKFIFLEGYLNRDDHGSIVVGHYLDTIRELSLGYTYITLPTYFSIKGQIARSLYVYLASQQPFYNRVPEGYSIRLSLLVEYLNYERAGRPWWRIWPHVENAIEELKKVGFVGKYVRDKKRHKKDGGVLTFWKAKKEKQVVGTTKPSSSKGKHAAVLDSIKEAFPEATCSDAKLVAALDKAEAFLEPYTTSLGRFVKDYAQWLDDRNLKFLAPTLFKPDNSFFKEFVGKVAELTTRKQAEAAEKRRLEEAERALEWEIKFGKYSEFT